jgi:hypothetical protein
VARAPFEAPLIYTVRQRVKAKILKENFCFYSFIIFYYILILENKNFPLKFLLSIAIKLNLILIYLIK